jgi:hypothetical protein
MATTPSPAPIARVPGQSAKRARAAAAIVSSLLPFRPLSLPLANAGAVDRRLLLDVVFKVFRLGKVDGDDALLELRSNASQRATSSSVV